MQLTGKSLVLISLMVIMWLAVLGVNHRITHAQIRSPDQVTATQQREPRTSQLEGRPVQPIKFQFHPKLLRSWWVAPKNQINRRLTTLIWS